MPKYVAYEWDEQELRIAGGSSRADGLLVESMRIIPLPQEPAEQQSKEDVPAGLTEALAQAGMGKAEALAVINRNRVELKQMSLPQAPPEEIPTLVRFQAMREFARLNEDWPLDYLPLSQRPGEEEEEESYTVLAAAIPPEMLKQIKQFSSDAGMGLSRAVLRPCGSASLFLRRPESAQHRLIVLIDIEANEADITVLHGRDPVLLRTARLAQDVLQPDAPAGSLLGEVRRTLPAAHNIVRGERVSAIYLSGATPGHHRLAEMIQSTLNLPCEVFDPFSQVEVAPQAADANIANPGVFVALLGAMLDEVQDVQHSFDFLNPRQPPAPASQRNRIAMISGIAAALILVPLLLYWYTISGHHSKLEKIEKQIADLGDLDEELKIINPLYAPLAEFRDQSIDWLAEVEYVSSRLKPLDAEIDNIVISEKDGGGNISLAGRASAEAWPLLRPKLTDERHTVTLGSDSNIEDPSDGFAKNFTLDITVKLESDANFVGTNDKPAASTSNESGD
ncbi:MAG: hypothetical protein MPJ50_17390 [Pirellulales bacterium]|nr:hypothetical protein [Pirellulales bacterium]